MPRPISALSRTIPRRYVGGIWLAVMTVLALSAWVRPALAGTSIIVAGQPFDVGRPVVLWNDPEGFDGYAQTCLDQRGADEHPCCQRQFNRFGARRGLKSRTLAGLQSVLRQVVLHFDGCVNSRSCFYSMQRKLRGDGGCGLSAHFMLDADGTIYQTLDLVESAWHAEQANAISVGIEICNRGDAARNELDKLPRDYRTRPVRDVVINGRTFHAFDFRPEQYTSILALVRLLVRIFPAVKPVYPERDGKPLLETLKDPNAFAGVVGHLHVDKDGRKWDPGAFDWLQLKRTLRGFHFPIALRGYGELPEEPYELRNAATVYARNAEERASGFFPVGPGALAHSGVHLRGIAGEPVHAPLRGRLLAARFGEHQGSSTSMALIRHDLDLPDGRLTFYTVLAHLQPQPVTAESPIPWVRELVRTGNARTLAAARGGQVALLDLPVEAGDVVGTIGWVRRGPEWGSEVHFETFTVDRPPDSIARTFRFLGGAGDGLFMARQGVIELLDRDRNRQLTVDELRRFFREGDPTERLALRRLAIRHVHEWGDRLAAPTEAAIALGDDAGSAEQARRYWETTTKPYVFWTAALAKHAGLPPSQTIYSFHPITFLATMAAAARGVTVPWPAGRSALAGDDPARLLPPTAALWVTPPEIREESKPLLGPVVGAEARIRKRSEIQLYELGDLH